LESFTKTDILNQVERICKSPDIKSKKLICRFLRFIVDETLSGRGDQLKGYTIGIKVFGKDTDFDPEQDSLVRIHAGRLRRLLRVYYLDNGKKDPIHIEIPKGGYKPIFSENNIGRSFAENQNTVLAIPLHEPSIAILPFVNLSDDTQKDYFAYGFSEELSYELSKYDDLKIINCWNRPDDNFSGDMLSRYGARFLIDGSIQIIENEIRVLVKLLDTNSGKQVWAERYKRNLNIDNLFVIQEDIAEEVSKVIGSEVGLVLQHLTEESNQLKPENLQAFDAILQFYYYEGHMSEEVGAITLQKLQQALLNDPNSGIINAMIANMYANAYALDYPNSEGAYEKMSELAEKAITLDAENIIVRIIYTYICFLKNQKQRFLQETEHCLTMKISTPMRVGSLGFHLSLYGEWEKGKELLDKAMNKHIGYPLYFHGAISLYYYRQNKFNEALNEAQKYDVPGLFWGPMLRIACLGKLNRKNDATSDIEQLMSLKPDFQQKAKYLVSMFVKEDHIVNEILAGLRLAELKI